MNDYQSYLKHELLRRVKANPQYSLRAFARALKLNHSSLSQILNGKKRLSETRAYSVAQLLSLDEDESDYFVALVRLAASEDVLQKQKLQEAIQARFKGRVLKRFDLSVDEFQVISEWYHFAILQLFEIQGCDMSVVGIAKRISLHPFEVEAALERLLRLKLIEKKDLKGTPILKRVAAPFVVQTEVRQKAMTQFYRQAMSQAVTALEEQSPSDRIAGWETLALSDKGLKKARALAHAFLDQLALIAQNDSSKSKVYCIFVHGYQLDLGAKPSQSKGKSK